MTATSTYWCTESLLVTIDGPTGRSTIAIDKPFARIGSHAKSEVVLRGDRLTPAVFICTQLAKESLSFVC